jgi:hypothetical protein
MMNKLFRFTVQGFLLLILAAFSATSVNAQTTFSAEEPITNPAKIPLQIMAQLKRENRVKQCIAKEGAIKNNWFSAAEVDLNGDKANDYVVKAENSCLFGANLAPFWIFHNLTFRYSLVLRADTLGLEILPETTDDYHNIKLSRATAVNVSESILKFDGANYR